MAGLGGMIGQKLYRLGEALSFVFSYAADMQTRKALVHIYASLSHPERYNHEVSLNLKIAGRTVPFVMRLSDIFIIAEILHEQQYKMESRLPANATIIDAGGNVGISAVWFLAHYPDAAMHVFEPAEDNVRFLARNIANFPKAELFQKGIGAETGTMNLLHGEFAGMHSLLPGLAEEGAPVEQIEVVTLADHMAAHGIDKIDLLKLDIEGSEMDAIRGLGDRIRDVNVIVGEVHEALIDVDTFYKALTDAGFSILWRKNFRESEEQQVHGFEAARRA